MNYNIFTSRTFWSIVALFIISGTQGIQGLIPANALPFVELFLGVLASYFHVDGVKNSFNVGKQLGRQI